MYRFFSKTDKIPKKRFFNPPNDVAAGSSSGQDKTGIGRITLAGTDVNDVFSVYRFLPSKYTLEQLVKKLLENAENYRGDARDSCLKNLLDLLHRFPNYDINKVPKNFHSNPLELVIQLGDMAVARELLKLKANVRKENSYLLEKIKPLLDPYKHQENNHQNRVTRK